MVLFVKRVGIIGGGIMGSQIADIMAINGKEVIIRDISEDFTKKAMEIVDNNLNDLDQFQATRAEKEIERIQWEARERLTPYRNPEKNEPEEH